MYFRFQTLQPDPSSGRPTGILVAAAHLRDSNSISIADEKWLREHLDYYNTHLKIPQCLSDPKNRRALSWFKSGSKMISRVWDLAAFMDSYDTLIEVINTRSPGTINYEDGHQIVAFPHKKSRLNRPMAIQGSAINQ